MRSPAENYLQSVRKDNSIRHHLHQCMVFLSVMVIFTVFWGLKLTGITLAGEAFCGKDEHVHSEECPLQTLICELEESEAQQDALMKELAEKEDEYDQALYEEWLKNNPPAPPPPDVPAPEIPDDPSDWIVPVPYYTLTSPFGMRLHPILGVWRMHNGVDLACAEGEPVYASRGGLVEVAGYQKDGAGNYIQLNHGDGFRSIYMHMTHYIVKQGDYVAPGQIIGYVGNTGLSKGAHLHFGISYQGTYVNPMEYIG